MPLRQLQRTLSRSIAAAVWRPAIPRSASFPGSSSCGHVELFSTARPPCAPSSNLKPLSPLSPSARPPPPPRVPEKPLFEELFPDEAKQRSQRPPRTASSKPTDALHDIPHGRSSLASQLLGPPRPEERPGSATRRDARPGTSDTRSMLVLSAASKHLAESDFLRVGSASAAHVQGWVSGIVRVIPARDPDTLEATGRYYVLFESAVAARAWRDEARRLWELARERLPGTPASKKKTPGLLEAPRPAGATVTTRGAAAADINSEVDGFTLVHPGARFELEIARYTRAERLLEHGGSIVEKLARKLGTPWLVLVVVDGGRISTETLRTAIRDDGVERNLAWRVKNLEGQGDGKSGILPFGRSLLRKRDKTGVEESLTEQGMWSISRGGPDEGGSTISGPSGDEQRQTRRRLEESRRFPRFIVPFLDETEARRFVRNWHRRQLILKMGHVDVDIREWEETRLLSVSLLW